MLRLVPEQVFSNVIFTFYNATTHPKTCGRYGELRLNPAIRVASLPPQIVR
jgi:hypothetical protein